MADHQLDFFEAAEAESALKTTLGELAEMYRRNGVPEEDVPHLLERNKSLLQSVGCEPAELGGFATATLANYWRTKALYAQADLDQIASQNELAQKTVRQGWTWLLAFAIWSVGAGVLGAGWFYASARKGILWVGISFALQVIAFFSFMALPGIHNAVDRWYRKSDSRR